MPYKLDRSSPPQRTSSPPKSSNTTGDSNTPAMPWVVLQVHRRRRKTRYAAPRCMAACVKHGVEIAGGTGRLAAGSSRQPARSVPVIGGGMDFTGPYHHVGYRRAAPVLDTAPPEPVGSKSGGGSSSPTACRHGNWRRRRQHITVVGAAAPL